MKPRPVQIEIIKNMKHRFLVVCFLITSLFSFCQEKSVEPYKVLKGHVHKVQSAFFSSDGKFIISHGWDNTVKIWDVKTFSEIRTLKGHTDQVWSAAISHNNKFIASGSMDRTFIIWDVETGEKIHQVQISPYYVDIKGIIPELDRKLQNSIYSVRFSPNGKQLAIASADKLVRIWDMEKSVFIDTLDGQHSTNWMWCRYSPDGNYLITGSSGSSHEKGVKVIWETETYSQVSRIAMSGSILFTENNELGIYAGSNSMNYYNLSDGSFVSNKTFPNFNGYFNMSPDKKYIVSCNEDSYIIIRNIDTQKIVWTYKNEKLEIHSAHFSPDGKYLIAGTPESDILVWKMETLIGQQ
jgi:WD40 repeat protein